MHNKGAMAYAHREQYHRMTISLMRGAKVNFVALHRLHACSKLLSRSFPGKLPGMFERKIAINR
jgi:hypothetical protein